VFRSEEDAVLEGRARNIGIFRLQIKCLTPPRNLEPTLNISVFLCKRAAFLFVRPPHSILLPQTSLIHRPSPTTQAGHRM
jgi:hypothetical protein